MPDWIHERFERLLLFGGDRVRDVSNLVKLDADAPRAPPDVDWRAVSPPASDGHLWRSARPAAVFETSLSLRSCLPREDVRRELLPSTRRT